jgi:hypothetical protein
VFLSGWARFDNGGKVVVDKDMAGQAAAQLYKDYRDHLTLIACVCADGSTMPHSWITIGKTCKATRALLEKGTPGAKAYATRKTKSNLTRTSHIQSGVEQKSKEQKRVCPSRGWLEWRRYDASGVGTLSRRTNPVLGWHRPFDRWSHFSLVPVLFFFIAARGWITSECFHDWIKQCFVPYIRAKNGNKRVLLLLDNHSSRFDIDTLEYCRLQGVEILLFPPNATHFMQPLDASCFGITKKAADTVVCTARSGGESITKTALINYLEKPLLHGFAPANVELGFYKTGIWPINRSKITDKMCMVLPRAQHR